MANPLQSPLQDKVPLTVGAVNDPSFLANTVGSDECHLVELRLDSLGDGPDVLTFATQAAKTHPLLITARRPDEGGAGQLDVTSREALLRPFLEPAAAIDLEIRSLDELSSLWSDAGNLDLVRIASFHDFQQTPDLDTLRALIDTAADAGTDVVKFAFHLNSSSDLQRIPDLFELETPLPLAVMGMGPLAPSSRLLAAQLGSVLNYGYLGSNPTAPGQWPASLLKEVIAASC